MATYLTRYKQRIIAARPCKNCNNQFDGQAGDAEPLIRLSAEICNPA
jgi:hypothetical protein